MWGTGKESERDGEQEGGEQFQKQKMNVVGSHKEINIWEVLPFLRFNISQ